MARTLPLLLLATLAGACAAPRTGANLTESNSLTATSDIKSQVAFDHGCPLERVRVIRSLPAGSSSAIGTVGTVDLDVCGLVRRYKALAGGVGQPSLAWLDVTTLYPATSRPPPLPPP